MLCGCQYCVVGVRVHGVVAVGVWLSVLAARASACVFVVVVAALGLVLLGVGLVLQAATLPSVLLLCC